MANYPKIISVTPSYLEHCVYMSVLFFFAGNRPRKYHLRRKCRNYKSVKMAVLVLALILIVGIYINYGFILNGATTTKVSPSGNDAIAVLHGMKSVLILNPNLMLTMTYQGSVVLQGILNVTDSNGINPINCSETFNVDVCLEWSNDVRLIMSVNRSAAQDLDCYDIEWTALQCVDQVLTDCFNIGTTHWYGGYQNFNQYWPLSKSTQTMTAYVSHDTRGYQKVLSLTWKEPEIWIYSALFFNVVPFQLHTLVPSSFPVINTRSVEVNILVP